MEGCANVFTVLVIAVIIASVLFVDHHRQEIVADPPAMIQQYEHTYTHNPDSCDYCKYHPKK